MWVVVLAAAAEVVVVELVPVDVAMVVVLAAVVEVVVLARAVAFLVPHTAAALQAS